MRRMLLMLGPPLVLALIFVSFPEIDLLANGLFYLGDGHFLLEGNPFFTALHDYIGLLGWGLFIGGLLIFAASWWAHATPRLVSLRRAALFVALVQLLGPGLVVNVVFKDQWGRARPGQVQEFGGERQFSPAWVISDQCRKNCSFVCGDASVGFGLLALAYVGRHRRAWFATAFVVGSALGLMRMGQGGHFFSDVIFSFYAVWFTTLLLKEWLLPPEKETPAKWRGFAGDDRDTQ